MTLYYTNPDILNADVGESVVLMNTETLTYYEATGVANRILELLTLAPSSEDSICQVLLSEFDVSEEHCRSTVQSFLNDALRSGIIRVSE
jgi:hypothetical protein